MSFTAALGPLARLSLSVRILLGLGLGIFVGLFFGESAAVLQPLADIYIRLMQMTVLPYLLLWVVFARSEGTMRHAYDYWILGRGAEATGPRWSIVRDVLGWVD